jgi:hypothetical protein
MKYIINNPYRIVGLLVGATAREQDRQIKTLKQFIEAEQDPKDDFSFPTLGPLNRTTESVNDAASKLNLESDKMNAALFWFYNGNSITDEPAFESIKEADLDQVLDIWTKLTSKGEVSQRNASAFSNLGTLYLSGILDGTNTDEAIFEQGISLKLKFLESDFVKGFKELATDETFKTTKKELQIQFLNQLFFEIEKNEKINSGQFISILSKQDFSAKEEFFKGFVEKPIEEIEKRIEEAKTKRKANKANALSIGKALYEQTSEIIKQLKSILGTSNLRFSSILDKVSVEILQCGIDYFSHCKDSRTDPGNSSMDLFRKAKTLAVGNIAKQRCQENTENLQGWIDDKPERDKLKKIEYESSKLIDLFESNNNIKTLIVARNVLKTSKPLLKIIKHHLGVKDEVYINFSTKTAFIVQQGIIHEVNKALENFEFNNLTDRYRTNSVLESAWNITCELNRFDLDSDFKKNQFLKNTSSLIELCKQFGVSTTTPEDRLKGELNNAKMELEDLKGWKFLRTEAEKKSQLSNQQKKIDEILTKIKELEN